MVRLEKIITERVFNNRVLGRARNITQPSGVNPLEEFHLRMTPLGRLIAKVVPQSWAFALSGLSHRFYRWNLLIRGFSWSDSVIFTDEMMRRSPVFEHIYRENMNPYYLSMITFRRRRFYKVDAALEGFSVQEEVQNEVRQQYLLRVRPDLLRFRRLLHQYYSEMIPQTHYTNGSIGGIFDLFYIRNVFLRMGWNRYFYNEEHYADVGEMREDVYSARSAKKMSAEEAREFMRYFNQHRPGVLAPDGQEVDFAEVERFLAENPQIVSPDGAFDLLGFLDTFFGQRDFVQAETAPCQNVIERPNTVGTDIPAVLNDRVGTPIM